MKNIAKNMISIISKAKNNPLMNDAVINNGDIFQINNPINNVIKYVKGIALIAGHLNNTINPKSKINGINASKIKMRLFIFTLLLYRLASFKTYSFFNY